MTKLKDTEGVGVAYTANAPDEVIQPIIRWSRKLYYSLAGVVAAVHGLMKTIPIGTKNILTVTHDADGTYSIASTSVNIKTKTIGGYSNIRPSSRCII